MSEITSLRTVFQKVGKADAIVCTAFIVHFGPWAELTFFFQAEDGIRDSTRDWSSDVCSSDLVALLVLAVHAQIGQRVLDRREVGQRNDQLIFLVLLHHAVLHRQTSLP